MNYREEVQQYVKEVWNYNQAVVDAFDDYDYELVKGTIGFNEWVLKRRMKELVTQIVSSPLFKVFKFIEKIKRFFK